MRCFEPFNYILFFFVILCTSVSCNDDEKNEEEIMTLTISPHKEKIHDPVNAVNIQDLLILMIFMRKGIGMLLK